MSNLQLTCTLTIVICKSIFFLKTIMESFVLTSISIFHRQIGIKVFLFVFKQNLKRIGNETTMFCSVKMSHADVLVHYHICI